jgi:hypothetical protein
MIVYMIIDMFVYVIIYSITDMLFCMVIYEMIL